MTETSHSVNTCNYFDELNKLNTLINGKCRVLLNNNAPFFSICWTINTVVAHGCLGTTNASWHYRLTDREPSVVKAACKYFTYDSQYRLPSCTWWPPSRRRWSALASRRLLTCWQCVRKLRVTFLPWRVSVTGPRCTLSAPARKTSSLRQSR